MGLFKKNKKDALQDKLKQEGKLNKQTQHLNQTIRVLEERLNRNQQLASQAKEANNSAKVKAHLATIDIIDQRLERLYETKRVMASLHDTLDEFSINRTLIDQLATLEETLPKSKRKKKPSGETASLQAVQTYLETMMDDMQSRIEGDPNSVSEDELNAFFNKSS